MSRRRTGFTLVETLVALAIAGAVLIPATLLMHRLLVENRRLDDSVAQSLRARETPVVFPAGEDRENREGSAAQVEAH